MRPRRARGTLGQERVSLNRVERPACLDESLPSAAAFVRSMMSTASNVSRSCSDTTVTSARLIGHAATPDLRAPHVHPRVVIAEDEVALPLFERELGATPHQKLLGVTAAGEAVPLDEHAPRVRRKLRFTESARDALIAGAVLRCTTGCKNADDEDH